MEDEVRWAYIICGKSAAMMEQEIGKWRNYECTSPAPRDYPAGRMEKGRNRNSISLGNRVVLSPARPKYDLDELLAAAHPEMQHDELDWGDPVGEELW